MAYRPLIRVICLILLCGLGGLVMGIAQAGDATGYKASAIVHEILVVGTTSRGAHIARMLLPFTKGTQWTQTLEDLTYLRLRASQVFDPYSIRITTEPSEKGGLRVIIRLADPQLLFSEPIAFIAETLAGFFHQQLDLTFYHPFQNGMNLSVFSGWHPSRYRLGIGYHQTLIDGWYHSGSGMWSLSRRSHIVEDDQNLSFTVQELSGRVDTRHIPHHLVDVGFSFGIDQNQILSERGIYDQSYFLVEPSLAFQQFARWQFHLQFAYALLEGDSSFAKAWTQIHHEWSIGDELLSLTLRGGMATPYTPRNYQFTMGGFGENPLRGHSKSYLGPYFTQMSVEYRHHLSVSPIPLWLIGFVDVGQLYSETGTYRPQMDAGAGFVVSMPIPVSIRGEIGFSLTRPGDWNFSIRAQSSW